MRFSYEALKRAREIGLRGVMTDGHTYTCNECGSQWEPGERHVLWPISVAWVGWRHRGSRQFESWGSQVGWDGIERRVFARHVRVGPVVVSLGWRGS